MNTPAPLHLLLVDDDLPTLEMLRTVFATEDYDLRYTSEAATVVRLVADWTPDVAVVDLMMPEVDGAQVAWWLRGRFPAMRIIVYSARPRSGRAAPLRPEMGADVFLPKPFDLDALTALIHNRTLPEGRS